MTGVNPEYDADSAICEVKRYYESGTGYRMYKGTRVEIVEIYDALFIRPDATIGELANQFGPDAKLTVTPGQIYGVFGWVAVREQEWSTTVEHVDIRLLRPLTPLAAELLTAARDSHNQYWLAYHKWKGHKKGPVPCCLAPSWTRSVAFRAQSARFADPVQDDE